MERANIVWENGNFKELDEVRLLPFHRGLQFGDGLFETIRADQGRIYFLNEHMERINNSCLALAIEFVSDLDWQAIITRLLALNNLHNTIARIKLLVCRGNNSALGLPGTETSSVIITASSYQPPGKEDLEAGIRLVTYSSDYPNNLANHKSLNYLFNMVARQYANSIGYDEAILLDRELNISETSTGSLLFASGDNWITPESWFQLPGITVSQVKKLLKKSGIEVNKQMITGNDLKKFDKAFVINSLTGLIPVSRIDKMSFQDPDAALALQINKALFS